MTNARDSVQALSQVAPEGAKACSQGRKPLGFFKESSRKPRRGDRYPRIAHAFCRPFRASSARMHLSQGLAPLATDR